MNAMFPDPESPFLKVLSPLRMQAEAIVTDEGISTAQRVAFRNEINPAHALIVGEAVTGEGKRRIRLDAGQRKQLIKWVRQEYAGAAKYGVPMVLDEIISDIKNLRPRPSEIGFLESQTQVAKQIFEGAGVPQISAGQSESATYATSGVADHHL